MSMYYDQHYIKCLQKPPEERTPKNLEHIISFLHSLEALRSLRELALREIAKNVRYIKRNANDILYRRDNLSTCWYILLSGCVFIDQSMFLPRSSFGKRTSGNGRRGADCLILETSELLVIDYPEAHLMKPGQRKSYTPTNLERLMALEQEEVQIPAMRGRSFSEDRSQSFSNANVKNSKKTMDDMPGLLSDLETAEGQHHLPVAMAAAAPMSCYSDRSSMHSSMSSSFSDLYQGGGSSENPDLDLTGLVESTVDSDDEDTVSESASTLVVRDFVRDCLEKDPMDRTDDDIEILLDFMRHLAAFANMTMSVRRALCGVMVFAVVAKAGTVVMKNQEELDSWSVILNGHVEVAKPDGCIDQLHLGDSFGVSPTLESQFHVGVMRTTIDDCQFVCITQDHYYRILTQGEENIRRIEENGQVVMVTEHRVLDDRRQGHILIKATPERLISNLMEDHSPVDPTYVEDFLMSYPTYLPSPHEVCDSLLHWFQDLNLRDKVTRVLLLWVNNYYSDFERSPDMIEFLEAFEDCLEAESMAGQLRLLHIAGAAKAKPRMVVLARSDRDSLLSFSIVGGWEKKMGIFISKVERGSKAQQVGLRKGDQLLEVNGHNFEHVTRAKAMEILKGTTHLSITVKYNTLAFRDLIASQDGSRSNWGRLPSQEIQLLQADPKARLAIPALPMSQMSPEIRAKGKHDKKPPFGGGGFATLGHKKKLRKAMAKLSILPNKTTARTQDDSSTLMRHSKSGSISSSGQYLSNSNPDLTSIASIPMYETSAYVGGSDYPEHVLKLYRADQSCKYFLVHKETAALGVVLLAMQEHGLTEAANSGTYSLCEVTVAPGGMVKQRRLPDHQSDIASRLSLCGRLFLKNNMASENLMPDEVAMELLKDSQVTFLQLDSNEVAAQLTLRDYKIFQEIEATDYIENLFDLMPKVANKRLQSFEDIVNNELFWVVTEVCTELNLVKRAKIIKQFVKIARHCKDCKNFNSLFAIISGLGHGCVSRLRNTWDKVPAKYVKMFDDLQDLMDPSRNMSKYRNLISSEQVQPPLIPFFPVVKKDLTFIHLGNDTKVDGLINFEKLRMISREVRYIVSMANAAYDPRQLLAPKTTGSGSPLIGSSLASVMAPSMSTLPRKRSQGRRSSAVINPKKMWEEAQMSRRVKQYLGCLNVVHDEEELRELSLKCEPITNSGSMNSGQMRRPSTASQSSLNSTLAPPTTVYNKQEEEIKKIIYKDAPKTSFGATSPQNLRKLLSLSEEGESRMNTLKVQKLSQQKTSREPPSSGHTKVAPASPSSNSKTRRTAITSRGSVSSTTSAESRDARKLSPQRSDSGYGGSEAGSTTRQEHKPKYRQTGQPPGMIGPYDSSDSSQSCLSSNCDTQSNSSFGSSSPPARDHHLSNELPSAPSAPLNIQRKPPKRWVGPDEPSGITDRPRQPPDYDKATMGTPPRSAGRSYPQPPPVAEKPQRRPPAYAVATARKRVLTNSKSEACDFYDSDNEQVSVV